MDREEIIRMAREAGCKPFRSPKHWDDVQVFATPDVLERFATLVAAAEREAIAQSLDKQADLAGDPMDRKWAREMAAAVRARGEKI